MDDSLAPVFVLSARYIELCKLSLWVMSKHFQKLLLALLLLIVESRYKDRYIICLYIFLIIDVIAPETYNKQVTGLRVLHCSM